MSDIFELKLPSVSKDENAQVTVSAWFKEPGEAFEADEPLAELLFDKAAFDYCAPRTGVLKEIVIKADQKGRAGDVLARAEVSQ
ncbi:MAG: lipoyl domain-containing protein [Planctomycetota bacterium]|nr:lipoyl domain-containing protein [Planctomycetota bacterium]